MTTTRFVSFDGTEHLTAEFEEPGRRRALAELLDSKSPCAARGSGLSYCLASAGHGVTTISTRHFDRVVDFEPDRRLLTVEPGFTVGRLVEFGVDHASYFPVLPGHPSISVGGCTAFNVHGKTQHNVGHFEDHVESLVLVHPDHGELQCSRSTNSALFDLTVGGMGLTGVISSVTLRLQPLRGNSVRRTAHRVANVWEAAELMLELAGEADALYSWNDLNRSGERFGCGVVYDERFEDRKIDDSSRYRTLRPDARRLPVNAYRRPVARAINHSFLATATIRREQRMSVHDGAFPINGREPYYHLFGRKGFREYQLVVPYEAWIGAARELRRLLEHARLPVTLGSLKLFAGANRHLWFRGDGVCLTLDVPATSDSAALFADLDRLALHHGAIVNLAKDSRIEANTVRELFAGYDGFFGAIADFDPRRRFDSALRQRLEV